MIVRSVIPHKGRMTSRDTLQYIRARGRVCRGRPMRRGKRGPSGAFDARSSHQTRLAGGNMIDGCTEPAARRMCTHIFAAKPQQTILSPRPTGEFRASPARSPDASDTCRTPSGEGHQTRTLLPTDAASSHAPSPSPLRPCKRQEGLPAPSAELPSGPCTAGSARPTATRRGSDEHHQAKNLGRTWG